MRMDCKSLDIFFLLGNIMLEEVNLRNGKDWIALFTAY